MKKYSAFLHKKVANYKAINSFQSIALTQFQSKSVQLSRVRLFVTPWTAAHQASLSITNFRSLLKLMSITSVMPFNHLILCRPVEIAVEFLN